MVLSKHIRHCRSRCASVTRPLTQTASGRNARDNTTTMAAKMSGTLSILQKAKMSLQNRWKFLSKTTTVNQSVSDYHKNLQFMVSKEWMDLIQKVTYAQIENIRKFSVAKSLSDKRIDNGEETSNSKGEETMDKAIAVQSAASKAEISVERNEAESRKPVNQVEVALKTEDGIASRTEQTLREQIYAFPQVLSALFLPQSSVIRSNKEEAASSAIKDAVVVPKWKTNIQSSISKQSIASRTRHVLNSIATAESSASKWRRVEDLLVHIEQYPEARHDAIKVGAIGILLRARRKCKDSQINGAIREALTVMGYVDPLPGRGIRILSIDGGGIRGLVVVEMLKKLEELTGKKVHELFDYVCGVSTGAILSASLSGHKKINLDDISRLYKILSTKIFTRSTIRGTSNLVWSHAYYDTDLWEEMLQEHLGDKDLIKTSRDPNSPKLSAVSTVINHAQMMAYIFRNYTLPHRVESQYMGTHKAKLWEAVRASAAAPTYFEEFKHGEYLFTDGGLMVNNPCAVAIHEAKLLWPNNPIQCVVSFGTGRSAPSTINGDNDTDTKEITISSWKEKFHKILASATDTEAVHTMLNDLLPDHVYYRFNPYLTEMIPMEEIRPDKILQVEQDAMMYIRKNENKFKHAAKVLTEKRSVPQKLTDWLSLQKKLMGL